MSVWCNYRFLLLCFPNFFTMLLQLTIKVILLFLVQVGCLTVDIYLFSPKEFQYDDNNFSKGVKPQHEENGREQSMAEGLHFWITKLTLEQVLKKEDRGQCSLEYAETRNTAKGIATPFCRT